MSTTPLADPSGAAPFFAQLRPSIHGDSVGASLVDVDAWMPGAAWDGVAALFAVADDEHSRRGITAFLVEVADHIDHPAWQQLVLEVARGLEQPGAQPSPPTGPA